MSRRADGAGITVNKLVYGTVAMAGAALALSACGVHFTATVYHEDRDYNLDAGQLHRLSMHIDAANATVIGTDGNKITVHERLNYSKNRKPSPYHSVTGGTLAVGYRCPSGISIGFNECWVDYTVQVPRAMAADLSLDSGDLTLRGLGGDLQVQASSGNVRAYDLTGPSSVFRVDSGDVQVASATGGLQVQVSSGNARLTGLRGGALTVQDDSGDVSASFDTPPTNVSVSVSSGNARLTVPHGPSYALDTAANSGNVTTTGLLRNDASPYKIKAHVDSGDVTIAPG